MARFYEKSKNSSAFSNVLIWISLLCFFTPAFFIYHEPFSRYYFIIHYGCIALSVVYIFLYLNKNGLKLEKIYQYLFLFFISYLISSVLEDFKLVSWISTSCSIIGLYSMVNYYGKKDIEAFIKNAFWLFVVMMGINDFFMFLHPDHLFVVHNELGNQSYHFLSQKNAFSMFSFPLIYLSHICWEKKQISRPVFLMALLFAFYPPIALVSVTSITCAFLCEFVFLFSKRICKIMNAKVWIILIIVLSSMQLLFTYFFNFEIIQYIITEYMKKDPTLSGRTLLWDSAHELIYSHLLLGMGNGKNGYYFYTVVPPYTQGSVMWAHNTSLDLLVQGGISLFILFYLIIANSLKNILRKTESLDVYSIITLSVYVSYTIMGFTERFDFRYDFHFIIAFASILHLIKAEGFENKTLQTCESI